MAKKFNQLMPCASGVCRSEYTAHVYNFVVVSLAHVASNKVQLFSTPLDVDC